MIREVRLHKQGFRIYFSLLETQTIPLFKFGRPQIFNHSFLILSKEIIIDL